MPGDRPFVREDAGVDSGQGASWRAGGAGGPARRGLFRRYTVGARLYDALSVERPVYGAGRRAGIEMLALQPGEHVLDIGCETGLTFPLLHAAIGSTGRIVGVDASADMRTPTGTAAVLAPLARHACTLGGSDINAHPRTAVERDCTDVHAWRLRGGHIQVRAGALAGRNGHPTRTDQGEA